jgi:hypothetical protein
MKYVANVGAKWMKQKTEADQRASALLISDTFPPGTVSSSSPRRVELQNVGVSEKSMWAEEVMGDLERANRHSLPIRAGRAASAYLLPRPFLDQAPIELHFGLSICTPWPEAA